MAAAVIGVAASAKRCHLPLDPPFPGHPVPGKTVVAEAPRDFSAVDTWSNEYVCILTVGHDFHVDPPSIVSSEGSHVLVGALGIGSNCDCLSRSLLQVCLTEAGVPLANSFVLFVDDL